MRVNQHRLTAKEKEAMLREIDRQIAKRDEQYAADIDAMVLYALMETIGWKKKRLRKFWNDFVKVHNDLREFYQMRSSEDHVWLAHHKLNEIGVDVHQWYEEVSQ